MFSCTAVFALAIALIPQTAFAQLQWMNTTLSAAERTELLLRAMTLDQKIQQMQNVPHPNDELEGCGFQRLGRHVEGIRELAIPTLRAINGGNGVRGGDCLPEPTATALPSATPRRRNLQPLDQLLLGCSARPGNHLPFKGSISR